jgi:hypothetical protein
MSKRAVNLLKRYGIQYSFSEDQTFQGAVTLNGEVTISGPNTNGVVGVILADSKNLTGGADDYEVSMTQPANSTLLEVGLFFSQAGDASGNYVVDFGTSAGGQQVVANTTIVSSATPTVNSAVSTGGLKAEGAASLAFVTDYAAHVTSDTAIHCSVTTPGTNTTGIYRAYIKYIFM